jgi:hypothetical protein
MKKARHILDSIAAGKFIAQGMLFHGGSIPARLFN